MEFARMQYALQDLETNIQLFGSLHAFLHISPDNHLLPANVQ